MKYINTIMLAYQISLKMNHLYPSAITLAIIFCYKLSIREFKNEMKKIRINYEIT